MYLVYEEYKQKYHDAQNAYDRILSEKEELFAQTQPKGMKYDKDKITGGQSGGTFDNYLIAKEERRIDERLAEARELMSNREYLLLQKEIELRNSNDLYDRVYRYRFLDRKRIYQIARIVRYSESQVYRVIERINKSCEEMRENTRYNTKVKTG